MHADNSECVVWVFAPVAPGPFMTCAEGVPCCYLKSSVPAPNPNNLTLVSHLAVRISDRLRVQAGLAQPLSPEYEFVDLQVINGTYTLDSLASFGNQLELNVSIHVVSAAPNAIVGVHVLQSVTGNETTFISARKRIAYCPPHTRAARAVDSVHRRHHLPAPGL